MSLKETRSLLSLEPNDYTVWEIFKKCNASWVYDVEKGGPHAVLTSGKHSNAYFNLNAVAMFPDFCEFIASVFVRKLAEFGIAEEDVDVVLSSTFAATPFGQEIARSLRALSVFTEKKDSDQVWTGRFKLPVGCNVLHFEELITTMSTTRKVDDAVSGLPINLIRRSGKIVIGTIVHRPSDLSKTHPGHRIVPLIEMEVKNWNRLECPLCDIDSPALQPKQNWAEFMKYQ